MPMTAPTCRTARRLATTGGALLLAFALGACSIFGDSDDKAAKPPPGDDKNFPKLSSVPDKKPDSTTERQRMRIKEGLLADRQNARHVDGPVAGETELAENTPPSSRRVDPVVITPGEAQRVARQQRRQPARVDGVAITTNGLITAIEFPGESTGLPAGSGATIVRIAQLQGATKGKLTIIGRGATQAQGLARARAIANGLVNLGVSGGNIRVSGAKSSRGRAEVYISGGQVPKRPQ